MDRSQFTIIPLPRLRVIIHLHLPFRRRVHETLTRLLPVPRALTQFRTVSLALEEDAAHNQEAVDSQVDDQHECDVPGEQDDGPDQAEQAVSDDDAAQQDRFYPSGSTTTAVP